MRYTRADFRSAIQNSNTSKLIEILVEYPASYQWLAEGYSRTENRNPLDYKASSTQSEDDLATLKVLHAFTPVQLTREVYGAFDESISAQPLLEGVITYSDEVNAICSQDKETLKEEFIKNYIFDRASNQAYILTGMRPQKYSGSIYPESHVSGEHLRFVFANGDSTFDEVFAVLTYFQLAPGRGEKTIIENAVEQKQRLIMIHPDEFTRLNYYFSGSENSVMLPHRPVALSQLSVQIKAKIACLMFDSSLKDGIIRRNNGQYNIDNLFSWFADLLMSACSWFEHLKSHGIRYERSCLQPQPQDVGVVASSSYLPLHDRQKEQAERAAASTTPPTSPNKKQRTSFTL